MCSRPSITSAVPSPQPTSRMRVPGTRAEGLAQELGEVAVPPAIAQVLQGRGSEGVHVSGHEDLLDRSRVRDSGHARLRHGAGCRSIGACAARYARPGTRGRRMFALTPWRERHVRSHPGVILHVLDTLPSTVSATSTSRLQALLLGVELRRVCVPRKESRNAPLRSEVPCCGPLGWPARSTMLLLAPPACAGAVRTRPGFRCREGLDGRRDARRDRHGHQSADADSRARRSPTARVTTRSRTCSPAATTSVRSSRASRSPCKATCSSTPPARWSSTSRSRRAT